jgi:hypothetical protein
MAATRYATYKGRTYRLDFLGKTKYGERAHLTFLDGSKDFWVDAAAVSVAAAAPAGGGRHRAGRRLDDDDRCEVCDRNKYTCGHCVGW